MNGAFIGIQGILDLSMFLQRRQKGRRLLVSFQLKSILSYPSGIWTETPVAAYLPKRCTCLDTPKPEDFN